MELYSQYKIHKTCASVKLLEISSNWEGNLQVTIMINNQ